jgi:hypothetical protein
MYRILLLSLALFTSGAVFAQNRADSLNGGEPPKISPPIPVEVFAGNKGLVFQMIVNKNFTPKSRLGFFNVTNFVGDYKSINQKNQYLSQSLITVEIWKGFSVNTGATMNYITGFRPTAGLQYVFANRQLLVVALPRFDLTQTNNFETFGLIEYKPTLKNNWGLYTRLQGLYNYNTKNEFHDRSYVWLRVGAAYKNYQFGLGANFDVYGPMKIYENSFGVFIKTELF